MSEQHSTRRNDALMKALLCRLAALMLGNGTLTAVSSDLSRTISVSIQNYGHPKKPLRLSFPALTFLTNSSNYLGLFCELLN